MTEERRAQLGRARGNHGLRLGHLRPHCNRHAGLEDAGLLKGDGGDGLAKKMLVVERDRREHSDGRFGDNVGSVEAAAETDLEQYDIGAFARESEKGCGGGDLEKSDRL